MSDYDKGSNGELPIAADPSDPIDEASRKRMEKFHALQVKPTPDHMAYEAYQQLRKRHWFKNKNILEQCERIMRIMLCHSCMREEPHGAISASRFIVAKEKDELQVFEALIHLTCHECGFEEYYPVPKNKAADAANQYNPPKFSNAQQFTPEMWRRAYEQRAGTSSLAGAMGIGAADINETMRQYIQAHEDRLKNQMERLNMQHAVKKHWWAR